MLNLDGTPWGMRCYKVQSILFYPDREQLKEWFRKLKRKFIGLFKELEKAFVIN